MQFKRQQSALPEIWGRCIDKTMIEDVNVVKLKLPFQIIIFGGLLLSGVSLFLNYFYGNDMLFYVFMSLAALGALIVAITTGCWFNRIIKYYAQEERSTLIKNSKTKYDSCTNAPESQSPDKVPSASSSNLQSDAEKV